MFLFVGHMRWGSDYILVSHCSPTFFFEGIKLVCLRGTVAKNSRRPRAKALSTLLKSTPQAIYSYAAACIAWKQPVSMLIFLYPICKPYRFESEGRRSLSRRRYRPPILHPKMRRRIPPQSGLSSALPTRLTLGRRG